MRLMSYSLTVFRASRSIAAPQKTKAGRNLEIDDQAKEIVQELGTAINESVENSSKVADAIERLREAGYDLELTLRLEIGLRPNGTDDEADGGSLSLTDEDIQVLQRMKIRIDPD